MIKIKSPFLKTLALLLLLIYACRVAQFSKISVHFNDKKMSIYA